MADYFKQIQLNVDQESLDRAINEQVSYLSNKLNGDSDSEYFELLFGDLEDNNTKVLNDVQVKDLYLQYKSNFKNTTFDGYERNMIFLVKLSRIINDLSTINCINQLLNSQLNSYDRWNDKKGSQASDFKKRLTIIHNNNNSICENILEFNSEYDTVFNIDIDLIRKNNESIRDIIKKLNVILDATGYDLMD